MQGLTLWNSIHFSRTQIPAQSGLCVCHFWRWKSGVVWSEAGGPLRGMHGTLAALCLTQFQSPLVFTARCCGVFSPQH